MATDIDAQAPRTDGIAERRLCNQQIMQPGQSSPADVVASLGAVQAQEYAAARWALALRMPEGTTDTEIARAFDEGRILRTHVMRPTWHFVTPADIRWMLELTAPQVHRAMASYNRRLGLDTALLVRGARILERALRDGQYLTRTELRGRLERGGITVNTIHLAHLVMYAELEAIICSGPRRGRQFTYALLAERAKRARSLPRDEALAELARRYYSSHGPATIRDFVWWSGLRTADATRGLEMNSARREVVDGRTYWTLGGRRVRSIRRPTVHLLPVYDEYLVAYRDRDAVPHGPATIDAAARGALAFYHALVVNGQVAGTWRVARGETGAAVNVLPLRLLTAPERRALAGTRARYERFLEAPVTLSIGGRPGPK